MSERAGPVKAPSAIPLSILAGALLALFAAAPAAAQDTQQRVPITLPSGGSPPIGSSTGQPPATIVAEPVALMIAACDANGDAKVTRAELDACVKRSFAAVDTGNAGSIGYIGYSDWALLWLGDRNALPSPFTVDTDGDNRITLAELQAQFVTLFARFDTDKDGVLTRAELLTIKAMAIGDRPDPRGKKPKR
jgi:opacity protein-like surface antigen